MRATSVAATRSDMENWQGLRRRNEGQTMTEYVAVLGVISIGIILALTAFGGAISAALSRIASMI